MQSTNSEYGSPYLVVCHVTLSKMRLLLLLYLLSCSESITNVSGYVCNHGSPNGERDTASPRGRYGERPQRNSCLKIHM